jgi:hypothetical protein
MPVLASLQVILDSYQLANILPLVDLTETPLADQLQLLNVFLSYQKIQTSVFLQKLVQFTNFRGLMRGLIVSLLPMQLINLFRRRRGRTRRGRGRSGVCR